MPLSASNRAHRLMRSAVSGRWSATTEWPESATSRGSCCPLTWLWQGVMSALQARSVIADIGRDASPFLGTQPLSAAYLT
jgi:hypothetical protein